MGTPPDEQAADNDGFTFSVEVQVRFRDLDAMNHVNNAVYMTYFEIARLAFWSAITGSDDIRDRGMILAEQTCTYRSPARYNERLNVWLKPTAIGRSSFVYRYRIDEQGTGRLIATGRSVQVAYDYTTERTTPVSPDLRAALERAAGKPLGSAEC